MCNFFGHITSVLSFSLGSAVHLLSTEWVDYVEEPMKYQALRPQFFSMGGWGVVEWSVGWGVVERVVVGSGGVGVVEWVVVGSGGVGGGGVDGGGVSGVGVGDGGVGGVRVGGGGWGVVEWVVVGWVVLWWVVVGGVIRLSFQSNSNSQKLSLWCKKKSLPTQMDMYDSYMVSYRIS